MPLSYSATPRLPLEMLERVSSHSRVTGLEMVFYRKHKLIMCPKALLTKAGISHETDNDDASKSEDDSADISDQEEDVVRHL